MLRVLLMLTVLLAVGFAQKELLENYSDEGSGNVTTLLPGDDEDNEYEMSGSGEFPTKTEYEDMIPTIISEVDEIPTSDSYEDEPEVDYNANYDNGDNSSINIDLRKGETDEGETKMTESPVEEEIVVDIKESDGSETVEETIEINEADNQDLEVDEELEIITDDLLKDDTEPEKSEITPEKVEPNTEPMDIPKPVDPKDPKPVDPEDPKSASLLNNNQFLAAIIVGGCVGLLLAICVIAVFAYRLKKKDEGSYSLDDHKKPPSNNYQYTQGQEYYA